MSELPWTVGGLTSHVVGISEGPDLRSSGSSAVIDWGLLGEPSGLGERWRVEDAGKDSWSSG